MIETVYIETSIVGYLTARSTKNLILAANINIEVTREWWESGIVNILQTHRFRENWGKSALISDTNYL